MRKLREGTDCRNRRRDEKQQKERSGGWIEKRGEDGWRDEGGERCVTYLAWYCVATSAL